MHDRYGLTARNTEAKMEQWFGGDVVDSLKVCGGGLTIPIPIMGTPAYLMPGGGFTPRIAGGSPGFASLSDLISEATTGGKKQQCVYQKTGVAQPAIGASASLWHLGPLPAIGAAAAADPGGTAFTRASVGALGCQNPGGTDTLHLTTWQGQATVAGSLMLYDHLWGALINYAVASHPITGVPTRYQGVDAAGSFFSGVVTTALPVTAQTLTTTYMDQDGNTAEAGTAQTVRVSSAVNTAPFPAPEWVYRLNPGDTGLRKITQFTLAPATSGFVHRFIGHPLAILPMPAANIGFVLDGINSAFNLVKIETGAALAFMEFMKSAVTATTYAGMIELCSG